MSDFDLRQLLQDAEVSANRGNYLKSADLYLQATEIDHNCTAAWYGLGVTNAKLGNLEETISSFEQAHRINPDYGATNANLALILEHIDPERASNFAKIAIETIGENLELVRISRLSKIKKIELFEESHIYKDGVEITTSPSKQVNTELKNTSEEKNSSSQEEETRHEEIENEILNDFVNSKTARKSRAVKMSGKGDHAAAVNEWKELLKKDSSDIGAWKGLADALSQAGYIERANQCMQRVQELTDIKDTEGVQVDEETELENLVAAAKEVKEKKIIEDEKINVNVNVNVSIEWYNKGIILLAENNAAEALNCFDKALSDAPSGEIELRVRTHNGKGHALYQLEKYPESIQEYHEAVVLDPSSVTGRTLYNMGSSYAAIELYGDAVKCFEQAKNRGLGDEDSKLCKAQINRCKLIIKEQSKFNQ